MKQLIFASLLLISTAARADYLVCLDGKERATEIDFYNHDGKIVFQLSAPHKDEYLYIIGNCYSENEIGLPYSCEPAPGTSSSPAIKLNLISGPQAKPTAEFTIESETELIECEHHE